MNDSKQEQKTEVLSGEEKLLLDHDYDGIQELDHVLPRWWIGIFYATIIFSAWYVGYYMSGYGPNPKQELATSLKEIEIQKQNHKPKVDESNNEDALLLAFKNPEKIKHGSEIYSGKCLACHGDKGQGVVGPNLTDDYWIHGKGTLKDIASVVSTGVIDKGMPPWGSVLTPDELIDVVVFIHSLHGTNPPGAKPAQGEKQEFRD